MSVSGNSKNSNIRNVITVMQQFLIKWRGIVLILVTISIAVFEFAEHPDFLTDNSYYLFKELALYYGLIIIIAIMVELTLRANAIKNQTIRILDIRQNLSMQMSVAKDWDEVVTNVINYPSAILPVSATSLLIYDHGSDNFVTEQTWIDPKEDITIPDMTISRESCCAEDVDEVFQNIHEIDCEQVATITNGKRRCYHLLLYYGSNPVGIITLILPHHHRITQIQSELLSKTAEDIAISLNSARQRQEQHAIEVANAVSNERLEIARDLHDTLGQNLGYLHLKLDQILAHSESDTFTAKLSELERMRDISNESYELVRNTLTILHHRSDHQINELFRAHTQIIAKRAGISVKIEEDGQPRTIPPNYLKQLLFAFKESLYNIEKHSGARQAKVHLLWADNYLKVNIWDDGRGFDPEQVNPDGHYGLHIINERIQSLGGKAEIHSKPGEGTEVNLWLPISAGQEMNNDKGEL